MPSVRSALESSADRSTPSGRAEARTAFDAGNRPELAAGEREEIAIERRRQSQARRQLEQRLQAIDVERQELLATAREEARQELEAVRQEMRRALSAVGKPTLSPDALVEANRAVQEAQRELRALPAVAPTRIGGETESAQAQDWLRVGRQVFVRGLGQVGEITSINLQGGQAEVQLGRLRTTVDVNSLDRPDSAGAKTSGRQPVPPPRVTVSTVERTAPMQLDIRGRRADAALEELERYLDDAFLAGLPFVRIVHGKGTGALRQVVRDYLAGHPLIATFAAADAREGGDGATVAKFKSS